MNRISLLRRLGQVLVIVFAIGILSSCIVVITEGSSDTPQQVKTL